MTKLQDAILDLTKETLVLVNKRVEALVEERNLLKDKVSKLEAIAKAAGRLARKCHPEDVYTSGLDHAFHELDAFELGVKP